MYREGSVRSLTNMNEPHTSQMNGWTSEFGSVNANISKVLKNDETVEKLLILCIRYLHWTL